MKKLNLKLSVSIFREGEMFVAHALALDLSTTAKTFDGVKERLSEAVEIFFEEIEKMGNRDKVLAGLC